MAYKFLSNVCDFIIRIKWMYILAFSSAIGLILAFIIYKSDLSSFSHYIKKDVLSISKDLESIGEQPEKEE
jgi:hypothetical protein